MPDQGRLGLSLPIPHHPIGGFGQAFRRKDRHALHCPPSRPSLDFVMKGLFQ
jgi:hypothetical protein